MTAVQVAGAVLILGGAVLSDIKAKQLFMRCVDFFCS